MPQSYRQFHIRQVREERRWERVFLRYLTSEHNRAARAYPNPYVPDIDSLERIFRRLYMSLTIQEAKLAYRDIIEPIEGDRLGEKDIIDSLVSIASRSSNSLINIWRDVLGNFLQVRVAERITSITDTTQKNIMQIVEASINQGLGAEETARRIRRDNDTINVHRSRAIARTETITSMNQGKFMAAESSNLVMEKRWVASNDERTRDTHRDIDSLGEWIALDQDFQLQDMKTETLRPALYPGDNRLDAGNVVNCRCSLTFRPMRDESGRLIRKM